MMVLNLQSSYLKGKLHHTTKGRFVFIIKLLEGDTPPLQNEDWFLYVFYHQVTWREHFSTTKWRLERICVSLLAQIGFSHVDFRRATSLATKWDWVFTCCLPKGNFPCYKMRLDFCMLSSDGQIPLLQNDFRFLKVFQLPKRWKLIKCNSQAVATKCLAQPHFGILI